MLKRVFSVLVSIPLCLAQGSIFASREIDVSSSRPIQAPPFSYFGESQCDRDGNMYFHAVDSDFRQGQIFRLSSDGASGKFFRISGKFADPDSAGFDSFWVTNDGEVFLLASNAEEKYVFTFDHNGGVKAPAVLKVREDVQLTDFAVFSSLCGDTMLRKVRAIFAESLTRRFLQSQENSSEKFQLRCPPSISGILVLQAMELPRAMREICISWVPTR